MCSLLVCSILSLLLQELNGRTAYHVYFLEGRFGVCAFSCRSREPKRFSHLRG